MYVPKNWESVVMKTIVTRFAKDESGATAIEYGLIAAIVGIGIIVGLGALRDGLNTLFNNVKTQLSK
jgi:pilus assembly protein Flp/PilA